MVHGSEAWSEIKGTYEKTKPLRVCVKVIFQQTTVM
jgi:hypothetical protein